MRGRTLGTDCRANSHLRYLSQQSADYDIILCSRLGYNFTAGISTINRMDGRLYRTSSTPSNFDNLCFTPLFLIATHSWLGLYSYIFAVILSRASESLYLCNLALTALHSRGLELLPKHAFSTSHYFKMIKELNYSQLKRYLMPQILLQVYQIGLAIALFSRGTDYWLTYCGLVYFLMLFCYLPIRAVQSLEMDIFISLKGADLPRARWLATRAIKAASFGSAMMVIILNLLFIASLAIFTLFLPLLYELWVYFNLALIVRVLFASRFQLLMAAAIEYRRCYLWGLILLGFILPLQLVLVLHSRANLPLILLVDLAAWLLLSILLRPSKDFLFSPFIATSLKHRLLNGAQLPPNGWLHYNSVWSRMRWQSAYFILQFDADYTSRPASQRLLSEMQKINGHGTIATCLIPGWYAVVCPAKNVNITRIETCLKIGLAGHVRNIVRIRPDLTLQQNIANVLQASKRVRQSTSEQRSFTTLFEQLLKDRTLKQAQEICDKIPDDRVTFTTQLSAVMTSIQERFGEIPLIAWNGTRLFRVGQVGQSLLLTAGKLFTEAQRMRTLLPRPPSPFIAVASGGTILTLLDPSVLNNQADREKLRLWSCALTLTFSIQLMKVGQPLIELPEDLFYFITETVQRCIEQSKGTEQDKQAAFITKDLTPSSGNIPLLRGVSTRRLEDRKWRLITGRTVTLCHKVVKDNGGHELVRRLDVH